MKYLIEKDEDLAELKAIAAKFPRKFKDNVEAIEKHFDKVVIKLNNMTSIASPTILLPSNVYSVSIDQNLFVVRIGEHGHIHITGEIGVNNKKTEFLTAKFEL